jgi:hypothetical protein
VVQGRRVRAAYILKSSLFLLRRWRVGNQRCPLVDIRETHFDRVFANGRVGVSPTILEMSQQPNETPLPSDRQPENQADPPRDAYLIQCGAHSGSATGVYRESPCHGESAFGHVLLSPAYKVHLGILGIVECSPSHHHVASSRYRVYSALDLVVGESIVIPPSETVLTAADRSRSVSRNTPRTSSPTSSTLSRQVPRLQSRPRTIYAHDLIPSV